MRLFNFKSFPFFCCFLSLTIANKAYAVDNNKNEKSDVTLKDAKKVLDTDNAKKDNNSKKNVQNTKDLKGSKITEGKSTVKNNKVERVIAKSVSKVGKNDLDKKSNGTLTKKVNPKNNIDIEKSKDKFSKNKKSLESKKNNEVATEKIVLDTDGYKDSKIEKPVTKPVLIDKEENLSNNVGSLNQKSEVNEQVTSEKIPNVKKKFKRKVKKSLSSNNDKSVGLNLEDKKKNLKNTKKRRNLRAKLSDDKIKGNKIDVLDEDKEKEEFVGISSTEYLEKINSLVEAYSGKSVKNIDIRSKLKGKTLDVYNNEYKPYDQNGNQKLKKHDIQFKNQLVRNVDLKEKVNLPFFRANKEITKFFLEGISTGRLVAYFDQFLEEKMTPELLKEQLLIPKDVETNVDNDGEAGQELLFDAHDISVFDLVGNWIFDKNTSDFSEDPFLIKLIIPADKFADTTKIQRVVCCIRYVDAVEFLKSIPEAAWIHDKNEAVELTIGEAFCMKLFDSNITYIGNRDCNNGEVNDLWGVKEKDSSFGSRKALEFKAKFEGSLDSI